jgi:hypothetical protein
MSKVFLLSFHPAWGDWHWVFYRRVVIALLSIEKIDMLLISQWYLKVGRMRPRAVSAAHSVHCDSCSQDHTWGGVVLVPRVPEAQLQATSFECQKFAISPAVYNHFGMISRVKLFILIPCGDSDGACGVGDND